MDQKYDNTIVYFAKTNFRGAERTFGIKNRDRRQHLYVVGKTGTGKTVFLKNMAIQDIQAGRGIAVVDPHGEFVEELLSVIPPHRINDVIYFNPSDMEYPIGFNVLEVSDPQYKHLVASDLMGIFTKIWANVWSPRMEYILQNCVLALLDTPGSTLLGISRILVDKDYRAQIVANIKDPVVKAYWVSEYEGYTDRLRSEAIVPIQNKVGQFLNTAFIRNVVGQPKSTFSVQEVMQNGKILLVNVSKGRIGEDNAGLLGAMVITKLQLAAMERVRVPEEERRDFYLYVDEFQNFATEAFAAVLSEARKYRLDLVIAHQYIGQLVTDISTKVRDAVFGNVGTQIVFRIGAADAEFLEKEFAPEFNEQDLVNLPNYQICLKLMVDGITSRPFSATTLPPIKVERAEEVTAKIIQASRQRYTRPRREVEEYIDRWSSMLPEIAAGAAMAQAREEYEAVCSSCGKTTKVSFKPDLHRPIFCLACLKKVREGDLPPVLVARRHPASASHAEHPRGIELAEMGIEFSPVSAPQESGGARKRSSGQVSFPRHRAPEKQVQESHATPLSPPPAPKPGETSPIPLHKALAHSPAIFKKQKRKEVNIGELRKLLEESLGQELSVEPRSAKDPREEPPSPNAPPVRSHPDRRGTPLEPGKRVTFDQPASPVPPSSST